MVPVGSKSNGAFLFRLGCFYLTGASSESLETMACSKLSSSILASLAALFDLPLFFFDFFGSGSSSVKVAVASFFLAASCRA